MKRRWIYAAVIGGLLAAVYGFGRLVHEGREAARRSTSKGNLKATGLALSNYHYTFETFPPGQTTDGAGEPLHSWQTLLLPFVDAEAAYNLVDFTRPWDHPVNVPVNRIQRPIYLYAIYGVVEKTDEQGFSLTHYAGNSEVFGKRESSKLGEFEDGDAHTILVGEATEGERAYASPGNWRDRSVPFNTGPKSFGRPDGDGAQFVYADGSVRFVANQVDPRALRRAAPDWKWMARNPVYEFDGPGQYPGVSPVYALSNSKRQVVTVWLNGNDDTELKMASEYPDLESLIILNQGISTKSLAEFLRTRPKCKVFVHGSKESDR